MPFLIQTILDLAAETHSYSILEDKTHIHTYITSRWNGALDPTTWWFKVCTRLYFSFVCCLLFFDQQTKILLSKRVWLKTQIAVYQVLALLVYIVSNWTQMKVNVI